MPRRATSRKKFVAKLRQVDVLTSQGQNVAERDPFNWFSEVPLPLWTALPLQDLVNRYP